MFDLNPCTGVSLRVNQSVNIAEGEIQKICVLVENHQVSRERVIPISVSLVTKSVTSGMSLCGPTLLTKINVVISPLLHIKIVDTGDYSISHLPVNIPTEVSETCFQITAIDDDIVENNEEFMLVVDAVNLNDIVDGNTAVNISDNDGRKLK